MWMDALFQGMMDLAQSEQVSRPVRILCVSLLSFVFLVGIASLFLLVFVIEGQSLLRRGVFLFNIEHPVFASGVYQDWIYGEDGKPKYWPVDDSYYPGQRVTRFLGCEVVKQHHTLTQILMGLLNCGFALEVVEEVQPSEDMLESPGMKVETPNGTAARLTGGLCLESTCISYPQRYNINKYYFLILYFI